MGIFRNLLCYLNPKDPKSTIKIAYQAAINSGKTHDEAMVRAIGFWFNSQAEIVGENELLEILKKAGSYDNIDKASRIVDRIETLNKETGENHYFNFVELMRSCSTKKGNQR